MLSGSGFPNAFRNRQPDEVGRLHQKVLYLERRHAGNHGLGYQLGKQLTVHRWAESLGDETFFVPLSAGNPSQVRWHEKDHYPDFLSSFSGGFGVMWEILRCRSKCVVATCRPLGCKARSRAIFGSLNLKKSLSSSGFQNNRKPPPPPPAVSYTHLTLPTSDLV